jgi:hypothetical protein
MLVLCNSAGRGGHHGKDSREDRKAQKPSHTKRENAVWHRNSGGINKQIRVIAGANRYPKYKFGTRSDAAAAGIPKFRCTPRVESLYRSL